MISNTMEVEMGAQDDEEVMSDTFDRVDEDSEETEDSSTSTESVNEDDDDTTEDSEETNPEEELQLEDDDEVKLIKRTGRCVLQSFISSNNSKTQADSSGSRIYGGRNRCILYYVDVLEMV